jgi:alkanesulfonate monooxygenase SsuD/methylene tetrahydromethanopterin reductase-like flavin-dependent oxidoreductase (luciferase family)
LRDLKFGVFLPFYAFGHEGPQTQQHFSYVQDIALECERLGYHSLWLDDHLMFKDSSILECWTTLSALSSKTRTIRLGTMATCNSFRHPALLAKMAATIDNISKGRLELGIGSGIQQAEHVSYGIPFPKPSDRTSRLNESVEIIKKMWTQEKTSYAGKHYQIDEAFCEPKPVQKPHPPITIAGGGEKLTLKVTAQHADRCKAIGRDYGEIEKSCWPGGQVFIASKRRELDEKLSQRKPRNMSIGDFAKTNLVGTPEQCRRSIQQYVDLGVTFFMLFFGDLPSTDGLGLFAQTIIKTLN